MEWLSVSVSILLYSSFVIAPSVGDYSTGAIQAIRCMLLQTAVRNCSSISEVSVPPYLTTAYNDSPHSLHEALRTGQFAQLTFGQLESLPVSLLYLIPRGRLADLSGSQLAAILQKNSDDTSIAHQLTASVQQFKQLLNLIKELKRSDMPQEVLQILGESINAGDLNETLSACKLKEPLLAYLRPSVMLCLSDQAGFQVLTLLKGIHPPKLETIHFITEMALKTRFPLVNINWLVLGLSADDIKDSSLEIGLNYNHFKLDLGTVQARAMFEQIYHNRTLNKSDLINCLPVLHKLTPLMLQRVSVQDYRVTYDSLLRLSLPQSLATACQIQEFVKASCRITGKLLSEDDDKWGFRIKYLGQWAFTVPLRVLEEYLDEPLTTSKLNEIDTPALSALQVFYLTGRGKYFDLQAINVMSVSRQFLRALPASQFLNIYMGNISSTVVEHLAYNMPADNLPRTLAFMYRTAANSDWFVLEKLLDNSDINIIINLLSPKDLQAVSPEILKWVGDKSPSVVRHFPQQVLAALLEQAKRNGDWSWQHLLDKSHVTNSLVGGLSCHHIEQMDVGLFVPIMAEYNRHRRKAFPRNLQICSIQKLIKYLKFKMTITQSDSDLGLISLLEPIDIESVGGYVLAGLPVEVLRMSPYLGHILTTIGKLSNAELILAANLTQLQLIAQLTVDKNGKADVYVARNLVWFLPPNTTIINFKLVLQSGLLDKTLCLPLELRRSLALNLLAEFGPPDMWSMGVLATLQDLLIVFNDEELSRVNRSVWTDTADTLVSHYGDNVDWIKPTPFYMVCTSFLEESEEDEYKLSLRSLVRWRLMAAQWILNTVYNPSSHSAGSKLSVDMKPIDYNDVDERMKVEVFNPSLEEDTTSKSEETTTSTTETTETTSTTESTSTTSTTESTTFSSTTVDRSTNSEVDVNDGSSKITPHTTERTTKQMSEVQTIPAPSTVVNNELSSQENGTFNNTAKSAKSTNVENNNHNRKLVSEGENSSNKNMLVISNEENDSKKVSENSYNGNEPNVNKTTTQSTPHALLQTISSTTITQKILGGKEMNTSETDKIKSKTEASISLKVDSDANSMNLSQSSNTSTHEKKIETSTLSTTTKHSIPNVISDNQALDENDIEEDTGEDGNSSILEQNNTSNTIPVRKRRYVFTSDNNFQLTCNALRMVGPLSAVALTEKDLENMLDSEVEECRVEFGAMDLSLEMFKDIWKRISLKKKLTGTHLLGKLLQGLAIADLWNVNVKDPTQPWALETINALITNVNDHNVLQRVIRDLPQDLSPELLAVLGDSICLLDMNSLNTSDIPVLGLQSSTHCPSCLPFFAEKAIQQLGPVSEWTQHHVHWLNNVVAGLDIKDWKLLTESPLKPLSALQPSAITCLNNSHLEVLTPEHIQSIPTLTLHALSPQQIAVLYPTQIKALRHATQVTIEERLTPNKKPLVAGVPGSGALHLASTLLVFISSIYLVYHAL